MLQISVPSLGSTAANRSLRSAALPGHCGKAGPPGPSQSPPNTFFVAVCGEEEVPSYHQTGITDMLTCVSRERLVFRPTWPALRSHLIVRCDDVEEPIEPYLCPNEEHVKQIIEFGQGLLRRIRHGGNVRLLVHCAAGISRSPAAALVILSMRYGQGAEARAVRHLASIRPGCRPNTAIVRHGDSLLQRGGRLLHEVTVWRTKLAMGEAPA